MSVIKAHLRRIIEDHKVTTDEVYRELMPAADKLPLTASKDARAILESWLDDKLEIDAPAQARLQAFLTSRGYPVGWARGTANDPQVRERIIRGNVTELDPVFAELGERLKRSDETAIIAVLDNEFDLAHPAIRGRLAENHREIAGSALDNDGNGLAGDRFGYDFATGSPDVSKPDDSPHGTHVLAIATQGTTQVKAVPIKVWNGAAFDARKCADAIDYAVARGAKVINMSLMTTEAAEVGPLEEAIRRHPEVLFVLGAGNRRGEIGIGRYGSETYLGTRASTLENLVLVTATGREDGKPDGTYPVGDRFIELVAPASRLSAVPGDRYRQSTGSSMAAPHVSSIAGKCLALDPTLSPQRLRQILSGTSDVAEEWLGLVGAQGSVNSDRAIRLAAAHALVRHEGMPVEAALDELGLAGVERVQLERALTQLLG